MKYSIRKLKSDAQRAARPKVCRAELVGLAIRDENTLEATFELEGLGEEGSHLRLMFSVEDGDCPLLPDFASRLVALLARGAAARKAIPASTLGHNETTRAQSLERDGETVLTSTDPKEVEEAGSRIRAYLAECTK